jgi:predicted metal-dependent HD superfamily phosphohydrolase
MDYNGVKNFIIKKLRKELSANLYYHTADHSLDVLCAVELYGKMEKVSSVDLILLKTAALFHDSGFLIKYFNNEVASVQLACEILPGYGYSLKQIEKISRIILSTEFPHKPKNKLDRILCDADLDYLGRDDFFMISIRLFREWNEHGIITSLKEWYIQEVYFLEQHAYFTVSAFELRNAAKKLHLQQIRELLGNNI